MHDLGGVGIVVVGSRLMSFQGVMFEVLETRTRNEAASGVIENPQLKQTQSFRPNNSLHLVPTTSASTTVSMNDSPSSLQVFVPLAVFLKMKGNRVPCKSTTLYSASGIWRSETHVSVACCEERPTESSVAIPFLLASIFPQRSIKQGVESSSKVSVEVWQCEVVALEDNQHRCKCEVSISSWQPQPDRKTFGAKVDFSHELYLLLLLFVIIQVYTDSVNP